VIVFDADGSGILEALPDCELALVTGWQLKVKVSSFEQHFFLRLPDDITTLTEQTPFLNGEELEPVLIDVTRSLTLHFTVCLPDDSRELSKRANNDTTRIPPRVLNLDHLRVYVEEWPLF
jgi:hypothetical protein